MTATLGPFVIGDRIARGATAQVWNAVHEPSGTNVAVKVIAPVKGRQRELYTHFSREVRAHASLFHPGIVTIHDHGQVDLEESAESGGELAPGSPYLVMELATHGTLRDLLSDRTAPDYAAARGVLLDVLDALAHAHARGVVHRDVKPANILVTSIEERGLKLKLTDFGIARALRESLGPESDIVGTPSYMAPEQIEADSRRLGPWTDLYAVGCLAHRLITGRAPFAHVGDLPAILTAHLDKEPPPIVTRHDVPEGLDEWVRRLLAKSPGARFRRAADAAAALIGLGTIEGGEPWLESGEEQLAAAELVTLVDPSLTRPDSSVVMLPATKRPATAPFPSTWSRAETDATPMSGVGLGLFGVRTVPFCGRDRERDQLWEMLRSVCSEQRPRFVALCGPPGTGKSRLASWIGERAHEVGAATLVRAMHGTSSDPEHGWIAMLAREVGAGGLAERDALVARLEDHLEGLPGASDRDLLRAIATVFRRHAQGEPVENARPLGRQLLHVLAEERPLVIWLDDVQWGLESLLFVEDVLAQRTGLPALFVATVRADLLGERAAEAKVLSRLLAADDSVRIDIDALDDEAHDQLLGWLLELDSELVDQVRERTQGHPLFALQIVGDWVARGLLEPGPSGFRLRAGAHVEVPEDIHQLWYGRVERLVERFGADTRQALETAAALGGGIDADEWRDACRELDTVVPDGLEDHMESIGLARRDDDGWVFTHALLRESLARSARIEMRWRDAHAACARSLAGRYGKQSAQAERIGRHHLEADELQDALEPLAAAAEHRLLGQEHVRAGELVRLHDRVLDWLDAGPTDPRRVVGWFLDAQVARLRGDHQRAGAILDRVQLVWGPVPDVLLMRAEVDRILSPGIHAATPALRAIQGFVELGNRHGEARARALYANTLMDAGVIDSRVLDHLSQAARLSEQLGDEEGLADCEKLLGRYAYTRGDFDLAMEHAERSVEILERVGRLEPLGLAVNLIGEALRLAGRFEEAVEAYERAARVFGQLGSELEALPRYNLVLVEVQRGDYDAAHARHFALEQSGQMGSGRMEANLAYAWLPICAARGEWDAFDAHMTISDHWSPKSGRTSMDFAIVARIAGDLAAEAGHTSRAVSAYGLAAQHYSALSRKEEAEECIARANGLVSGSTRS